MNIETLLSKSINKFNQTIRIVLPFIILYTLIYRILSPSTFNELLISNIENLEEVNFNLQSNDIIFMVLSFVLSMIYNLLIIKFIFISLKNNKKTFRLNEIFSLFILLLSIYILSIVPPMFMTLFIPFLGVLLVPIIYMALFFSIYIMLEFHTSFLDSLMNSYLLFKHNMSNILVLCLIHCAGVLMIIYATTLLGVPLTYIVGNLSTIFQQIIMNIGHYLLSIIWVCFYFSLDRSIIK